MVDVDNLIDYAFNARLSRRKTVTKIRREKKTGVDYVVFLATSQAQVARDLGITRQAVQRWVENGYAPEGGLMRL